MKVCTQCGWSLEELHKQSLLGCGHCLDMFQKELEQLCLQRHGIHFHEQKDFKNIQKAGSSSELVKHDQENVLQQMAQLQEALSDAVRGEQFEKAQAIKKEIQSLEKVHGK